MFTKPINSKTWLLPLIAVAAISGFVIMVFVLLLGYSKDSHAHKSEAIAQIISNQVTGDINHIVSILRIFSQNVEIAKDSKFYEELAASIKDENKYIFAINYVDPSGKIAKVYPEEQNKAALGQNLLARPDVNSYLIMARDQNRAVMSHRLLTFQKIYAFTLYVPIMDDNKKFVGWLNAVIDIDNLIRNNLNNLNIGQNISAHINWKDSKTQGVVFGETTAPEYYQQNHYVLNQELEISVGIIRDNTDVNRDKMLWTVLGVSVALLLLITLLLVKLIVSGIKVGESMRALGVKNTLLSSLSNDLSTPVMVLNLELSKMQKNSQIDIKQAERINNTLKTIEAKLKIAKVMNNQGLVHSAIKLEDVNLRKCTEEVIELLFELAQQKSVSFSLEGLSEVVIVRANHSVLVNNVLFHILTYALSSVKLGGTVKLSSSLKDGRVEFYVDAGTKKPNEAQIRLFQKITLTEDNIEGDSDADTGLAVLQIRTFMGIFEGSIGSDVSSDGVGRLKLVFNSGKS